MISIMVELLLQVVTIKKFLMLLKIQKMIEMRHVMYLCVMFVHHFHQTFVQNVITLQSFNQMVNVKAGC